MPVSTRSKVMPGSSSISNSAHNAGSCEGHAAKKRRMSTNAKSEREAALDNSLSLPSSEWFDAIFSPSPEEKEDQPNISLIGTSKTKRRRIQRSFKKRRLLRNAKINKNYTETEVIEISDGEDLFTAFPIVTEEKSTNVEMELVAAENREGDDRNATDSEKDSNAEVEVKEKDDIDEEDILILFESTSKNEHVQQKVVSAPKALSPVGKASNLEECEMTQEELAIIKRFKLDDKEPDWQHSYAVTLSPRRKIFDRISKYRSAFPKEFSVFNKSIWNHMTMNLQNDHTYTWKMRVRRLLHDIIRHIYPGLDCELVAVGSTVNGCGAYNSDMDLCLCLPSIDNLMPETSRSFAVKNLKLIRRKLLKEREFVNLIQFIPAKVPILKIHFKPPYDTLEVDLNVNNTPGIYNSFLLHYYAKIDDRFPALCLLVKHWAKREGIGEAATGSFNSYSLILMVLHFLQCGVDPPILPNLQQLFPEKFIFGKPLDDMKLFSELPSPLPDVPKNNLAVGELLIAFFDYFCNFDFSRKAISIARGCVFYRHELPKNTRRFKIFIEEPFDFQNTARCITNEERWMAILNSFADARAAFFSGIAPNLSRIHVDAGKTG